jgi:hypothetical protein
MKYKGKRISGPPLEATTGPKKKILSMVRVLGS